MCLSALPDRLQSAAAWHGTDMDNWFQRWILKNPRIHGLFAYGPNDKHWYHRWREFPIVLFAFFGGGESRWESSGGELKIRSVNTPIFLAKPNTFYLSRIQYWCDWSIQLQWPLFFAFHFYYGRKKVFYMYIGAHRDGDRVYWFPSMFVGLTWK